METKIPYRPLLKDDTEEFSEHEYAEGARKCTADKRIRLLMISNCVLAGIIVFLSTIIVKPSWVSQRINSDLKRVSYYTPLLDQFSIPVVDVKHDNTIFAHSPYAQPPSKEVDSIWTNLTHPRIYLVEEETIRRIGKDPEYTVQHPRMPGKHITYLAVHHQLHCLNDLRKNVFADYYWPDGYSSKVHMDHLQHCIDLIRETLMCNANLDLITFNWWELTPNPQPDFRVNMKCKDWSAFENYLDRPFEETGIFKWYEEHWMDGWSRQGGEKNVTIDKGWWDLALDGGAVTSEQYQDRWGNLR